MAWLYSQADIFVSAERRAGWSNTTAEAMACQIPVVCSRSGTRDFAFHNQTALVVPFPHPLLLRHQIKKLLKDEELRLRIARAGYEKIQKYSWSALTDRLEKIIKELVKLN
jgi:glycosyltransferase involved in cell wall biosynthesis